MSSKKQDKFKHIDLPKINHPQTKKNKRKTNEQIQNSHFSPLTSKNLFCHVAPNTANNPFLGFYKKKKETISFLEFEEANHRMIRKYILVVGFLCSIVWGCTLEPNQTYSWDEVWSCLQQIPASPDVQTMTMDMVQKSLNIYAFKDIVNDSPTSNLIHISVNLDQAWKNVTITTLF